jgi:hypothetical protein
VDDVGVFSNSIPDQQIKDLAGVAQLHAGWSSFLTGYNFDVETCPTRLYAISGCYDVMRDAQRKSVSINRDSSADAAVLPPPAFHWSHEAMLPFKRGQAWEVNQGYDRACDKCSHNGNAIFSYDLVLKGTPTAGKLMHSWNVAAESCGEPFYAVNSGTVSFVWDDGGWIDPKKDPPVNPNVDFDGPNAIRYQLEQYISFGHLHAYTGSFEEAFPWKLFWPGNFGDLYTFPVTQGTFLGRVGTRNGCHHHMGANNWDAPTGSTEDNVTVPFGFWAYEACDANCTDEANWKFVVFGTPRHGQWVRNPK